MKPLAFLILMVGLLGTSKAVEKSSSTYTRSVESMMEEQIMILNEKDKILMALIEKNNPCPSGWEKSNLSLRDNHRNILDDYVPVEVCKENGLLRIKKLTPNTP